MKPLLKTLGALPFFLSVFLNAFVDLGHKITIQNTIFKLYSEQQQIIATAILNALILLPFIILLSPAGYISDRFRRVKVMRVSAWAVLVLCGLIWLSYMNGWFWVSFAATFALAVQSAIYSPAKLSFVKEMFGKERLAEANGVMASLAILAILISTFAFSITFESFYGSHLLSEAEILRAVTPIGMLLTMTAALELICMYKLPLRPEFAQPLKTNSFNWKAFRKGQLFSRDLQPLKEQKSVRLSIIGLATFWGIGQVMLAAFPAYFKSATAIDNTIVIQGILACSGVGIAIGAYLAGKMSKNKIELGILPAAALGIAIGLLYLPHITHTTTAALDFFLIGICGGLFIVPLNSLIQFQAKSGELGRTLAASNWVQNVTMFSFLIVTVSFALLKLSSQTLLIAIAIVASLGFAYTLYQLPQSFLRLIVTGIMRNRYRVNVQGLKHLPAEGGALLLGNHVTWIDWAIVQMASPRPIRFVMARNIYSLWYLKWFFDLAGCIPIEPGPRSRKALDEIRHLLEAGEVVCLFPEGALSRTGHLGEFKRGFERACQGLSDTIPVIPFYLHGLWGSQFSYSTDLLKQRPINGVRRKIAIAFGAPLPNTITAPELKQQIFDMSIHSWQHDVSDCENLGRQWVQTAKQQKQDMCLADSTGVKLSPTQALIASTTLKFALKKQLSGQNIGVLLPASAGGALTNMALLQAGKTIVNLNYSVGPDALNAAIQNAEISTVITSGKFLNKLKAKGFDIESSLSAVTVIELETFKQSISSFHKLLAFTLCHSLPAELLKRAIAKPVPAETTACILFSSGSEGTPKGICLSHKNIQANIQQTLQVLNPGKDDLILGNLPLFHAFGLTVTQFLPLLHGVPVVFAADPTDAVGNAKLVARFQASIMFGTSTFFRLYTQNRKVHPLMLSSLRFAVSGAEKLNAATQQAFFDKFGKTIYEGYGATEATPVISVNLPDYLDRKTFKVQSGQKAGTVGMPLPGTSLRIVNPETFEPLPTGEAGMILIGGVQIMQGYLNDPARTEQVIHTEGNDRWYITGDKGKIDEDGFLSIVDRYSRFAKIGGEMISLGKVEEVIYELNAENPAPQVNNQELEVTVVNIPDEKRGEKLVALANQELAERLSAKNFSEKGLSNLALPSSVFQVAEIPKLASGKVNFTEAKKLALNLVNS
ncbi:acyl-[ACP]--phospholipid O-acyltransferase [Reinekea marinisedimentorum]|uniref:Acyl-[acyl-carrier-protein]-phospholipid O-acyltransferase/long-chain-fatty-acid--[acyl-carrier-protein] ligase n=1 Tax=Reinekea marinisedimentorum TaxID=230495 RepID=A0A4R3IAX6_9GAMM|nr:acyl-[ACP]--phospholipid O-acyltransferase [Reinekea marinisedimentorum]TCS42687.1 acyl-[acyl-carrier-protein]-phospholipid O-acyltransferase/long-chain-fatty-acid--[acyl-carrier-protein] ligase [Reinekea marinisedimentorum]